MMHIINSAVSVAQLKVYYYTTVFVVDVVQTGSSQSYTWTE